MAVAYNVSQPSLVNNFFKMGAYMYSMIEHTMIGIELTSEPFVVDDAVDDLLVLTSGLTSGLLASCLIACGLLASGLSFGTRGNLLKTAVIISHTGHCTWSLSVPFLINPLTPLSDWHLASSYNITPESCITNAPSLKPLVPMASEK